MAQDFSRSPSSVGSPGCHGWRTLPVALRHSFAPSFSRLHQSHSQRGMGADKMIVRAPPLQMGQQVWGLLCGGPRAACQSCHAMPDGQIHPLNESGIQPPREAQSLQGSFESVLCPQAHQVGHPNQLAPAVAFFHLAVDQPRCHLPPADIPPSTSLFSPCPKMGRQRIEIHIQPVTREEREATRGQELLQGVDDAMRGVLRARAQMEDGKQLRAGVDDQPEPQDLLGVAQPGAQFIQLEVRELKMGEEALVQRLSVLACA